MEIAAAALPARAGGGVEPLIDYVTFAKACQDNATPTLAHACYTIAGQSRPWTEQSDGPALQTLAVLQAYEQLDQATQALAVELIAANLSFLLGHYTEQTTNLWEEHSGYSFFVRAAQLRCLRAISANTSGSRCRRAPSRRSPGLVRPGGALGRPPLPEPDRRAAGWRHPV